MDSPDLSPAKNTKSLPVEDEYHSSRPKKRKEKVKEKSLANAEKKTTQKGVPPLQADSLVKEVPLKGLVCFLENQRSSRLEE